MILQQTDWDPDVMPCIDLTEKDVENMAESLVKFHQEFNNCFGRDEHQCLGLAYFFRIAQQQQSKIHRAHCP